MSAFRSKADILQHGFHVRLVPGTDIGEIRLEEMAGGSELGSFKSGIDSAGTRAGKFVGQSRGGENGYETQTR